MKIMVKIAIMLNEDLAQKIKDDAEARGLSFSSTILEKLELAYGCKTTDTSLSVIMAKIIQEVNEFVKINSRNGNESDRCIFTLYEASKIFVDQKEKAKIGRNFKMLVDRNAVPNVSPLFSADGVQLRRKNTALYVITKE